MIFFTLAEIFRSVTFAAICGILFGMFYNISTSVLKSVIKLIFIIPKTFYVFKNSQKRSTDNKTFVRFSAVYKNVLDFSVFFLFGISVILLYYIILDGVFRLYVISIVTAMFFITSKSIGNLCATVYNRLFDKFYSFLSKIMYVLCFPEYKLFVYAFIAVKTAAAPLIRIYRQRYSKYITSKKLKQIDNIYNIK